MPYGLNPDVFEKTFSDSGVYMTHAKTKTLIQSYLPYKYTDYSSVLSTEMSSDLIVLTPTAINKITVENFNKSIIAEGPSSGIGVNSNGKLYATNVLRTFGTSLEADAATSPPIKNHELVYFSSIGGVSYLGIKTEPGWIGISGFNSI